MKALLIFGTIPLWPLLLVVGIPYGAVLCVRRLQALKFNNLGSSQKGPSLLAVLKPAPH